MGLATHDLRVKVFCVATLSWALALRGVPERDLDSRRGTQGLMSQPGSGSISALTVTVR